LNANWHLPLNTIVIKDAIRASKNTRIFDCFSAADDDDDEELLSAWCWSFILANDNCILSNPSSKNLSKWRVICSNNVRALFQMVCNCSISSSSRCDNDTTPTSAVAVVTSPTSDAIGNDVISGDGRLNVLTNFSIFNLSFPNNDTNNSDISQTLR